MSRRATTFLSIGAAVILLGVLVRAHSSYSNETREIGATFQSEGNNIQDVSHTRTLALQPEAIRLLRRVGGQRFRSKTPPVVVMNGVLTTGSDRQNIQISRYQNASGERVEILLASGTFSWDAAAGARSSTGTWGQTERAVLERLIFDSADQFILAQVRGASYQVVTRNLRPDNAPDNYAGPLWDLVRIDDPEPTEQKRPLSKWRIYYVNSLTGLIDKVVSAQQGERIEADFSGWTDRAGEKSPSTITWTSNGKTLMTFSVTNVSLFAQ